MDTTCSIEEGSEAIRSALKELGGINSNDVSVALHDNGEFSAEFGSTVVRQTTIVPLLKRYETVVDGQTYLVELVGFDTGTSELRIEVAKAL